MCVPHFFAPHTAAAWVTAVCGAKKCWIEAVASATASVGERNGVPAAPYLFGERKNVTELDKWLIIEG